MTYASEQHDLVDFETLTRTPSVAESTTGQFAPDVFHRHRKASGKPLDDDDEGTTVRLSGGEESQHRGQVTGRDSRARRAASAIIDASGRIPVQSTC